MPVKFIAEASSNHGQDLSRALAFVDAAADPADGLRPLQHVRASWVPA